MTAVLHLIDAATSQDSLDQLSLWVSSGDRIVSLGSPPPYANLPQPMERVHCPLGLSQLAALRMGRHAEAADVMCAWSPKASGAVKSLARRRGVPKFVRLSAVPNRIQRSWRDRLAGWDVIVPTQAARQRLLRMGLKADYLHTLPPAAETPDPAEASLQRQETRRALGVGDSQSLLVAPEAMVRGAGHKYASWAHAILRQILPNVLLCLPGSGPNERHVRTFAGTTGYDSEVFLPGDRFAQRDILAAADVALFLAEADVGVSALAAAMAAGVPIVASNTPDIAEWAVHNQTALLCPPRDPRAAAACLLRLIEQRDLADRFRQVTRRQAAEQFAPETCKVRLKEYYAAACSRSA